MTTPRRVDDAPNTWAVTASVFAAAMLIVAGIFQFFEGLVAVINGDEFLATPDYIFQLDTTSWGWIHLILGVLAVVVGALIFGGNVVARGLAIVIVALSAVANFLWLPYYPVWGLILIGLNVFIIWGLSAANLSRI